MLTFHCKEDSQREKVRERERERERANSVGVGFFPLSYSPLFFSLPFGPFSVGLVLVGGGRRE